MVHLRPPSAGGGGGDGWTLPEDELRAAFTPRTKLLVLNSPQNPIGKVFTRAELELLAGLVLSSDAYALCDEVYEHLVFDGLQHVPLMSLPGMADRTIRVGSAGKALSFTGWKVWAHSLIIKRGGTILGPSPPPCLSHRA